MKAHTRQIYLSLPFVFALLLSPSWAAPETLGDAMQACIEADWIRADRAFGQGAVDTAQVPAQAVTTAQDAAGACDGIQNGRFGFHVASGEQDPWWQVDLGKVVRLDRVVIHNRTDGNTAPRTRNIQILVSESKAQPRFDLVYQHNGDVFRGGDKALRVTLGDRSI